MIDVPTLFILGAGAGKPYGFKTAAELKSIIVERFVKDFERLVDNTGQWIVKKRKAILMPAVTAFVNNFAKSPMESVDSYLAYNPDYSYYGKMAIAMYMREMEKNSKFHNEVETSEDWYGLLFRRMMPEGKKPEDFMRFRENKVAFVTFNYDRSLEYLMYDSFCSTFHQSKDKREFVLSECVPFPIVHVYGQLGDLSATMWLDDSDYYYREGVVSYAEVEALAESIQIVGEISGEVLMKTVKEIAGDCVRIYFLGFGYAEENVEGLGWRNVFSDTVQVYGTAIGKTTKEISGIIARVIKHVAGRPMYNEPHIEPRTCYSLLREYP